MQRVRRRRLAVGAGLVLGATLGAGPAFAQTGPCDWEWGGIVETVPAQCNVAVPVFQDEPVDVQVVNESPWLVEVEGTVPVEEQGPSSEEETVEQLANLRGETWMGFGMLIFLLAIHVVGTWVLLRRRL